MNGVEGNHFNKERAEGETAPQNQRSLPGRWPYATPGIADTLFARGRVPMTKAEVRCLTLSRLRLQPGHRVVDVGAGTGSISIECALVAHGGCVYAVEKDPEAVCLIEENVRLFNVENLKIIQGPAPEALEGIGPVERIVVGGTAGRMKEIFLQCHRLLRPGGILVVNCILLESLSASLQFLEEAGFVSPEILSVQIARGRKLGKGTALQPQNQVFIISATSPAQNAVEAG